MRELNMLEIDLVSGGNPIVGAISGAVTFGIIGCLATPVLFWVDLHYMAPYVVLGFVSVGSILGMIY